MKWAAICWTVLFAESSTSILVMENRGTNNTETKEGLVNNNKWDKWNKWELQLILMPRKCGDCFPGEHNSQPLMDDEESSSPD